MGAEVLVLEAFGGEVGVDLGRGYVGVPEHLLENAQVASTGQEMRGEAVPQRVRAHAALEPGGAGVPPDDLVEPLAAERSATLVDEERGLLPQADHLRTPAVDPRPQGSDRATPDGNQPFL